MRPAPPRSPGNGGKPLEETKPKGAARKRGRARAVVRERGLGGFVGRPWLGGHGIATVQGHRFFFNAFGGWHPVFGRVHGFVDGMVPEGIGPASRRAKGTGSCRSGVRPRVPEPEQQQPWRGVPTRCHGHKPWLGPPLSGLGCAMMMPTRGVAPGWRGARRWRFWVMQAVPCWSPWRASEIGFPLPTTPLQSMEDIETS